MRTPGTPFKLYEGVDTCFFPLRGVPVLRDESWVAREQDRKALANFARFIEKQGGKFDASKAKFTVIPPSNLPHGVSVSNFLRPSLTLFFKSIRSRGQSRHNLV
jgi:hypothetical protein